MKVSINGEPRELEDGLRLDALIEALQLGGKRLAIEINREIVPRSQYGSTALRDGDTIEIVHAIGGG